MNDDQFFERLRQDAASLRYEPDGMMANRIAARVRERVAAIRHTPTVAQLLAGWLRPLVAAVAAVALVTTGSIVYVETQTTQSLDSISATPTMEISMAGAPYSVSE